MTASRYVPPEDLRLRWEQEHGQLVVEPLLAEELDITEWWLIPLDDGTFRHPESGETGPLPDLLASISLVYRHMHADGRTR